MSEEQALLLRASAFATLADVKRFLEWYAHSEHCSTWDEARYEQARAIMDAGKPILRDCTGVEVDEQAVAHRTEPS